MILYNVMYYELEESQLKSLLKKLIPLYAGFLFSIFLIYSKHCLHLINGSPLRTIAGIIIMILLIGLLIFMTIYFINKNTEDNLPMIESEETKTEEEKLEEFITYIKNLKNFNLGPFEKQKKQLYDMSVSMKLKYANIQKLLKDSFSETDLTYSTYNSTLNEVLKIFNKNMKGIQKRIEVFDYNAYKLDSSNENANEYITEVKNLYDNNDVVIEHIDDLMHELVSLDDISEMPLEKVNMLIEQTQNYKNIKERDEV